MADVRIYSKPRLVLFVHFKFYKSRSAGFSQKYCIQFVVEKKFDNLSEKRNGLNTVL